MSFKKPRTILRDHARVAAHQTHDLDVFEGLPDAPEADAGRERSLAAAAQHLPVTTILATVMAFEALSARDRRRIERGRGIAVVVGVPAADWLTPVEDAMSRLRSWGRIFKRSGESRTNDKPEAGNDVTAELLADGSSVLGVSTAPERYLPSALMAAADVRVTLGIPSAKAIRTVIRLATGRSPRSVSAGLAAGLTATEIAACIRKGSGAAACVRRLEAASASKRADADQGLDDVPLLADCLGYGEAQAWGLRLVAAIEEHRRGERPWSSIENRNILLSGDAGTGKTRFARILAKSAGLPLIATSVSSWFASTGGYLHDICKAVDAAFARASAQGGPAILLLDEIDSVPNRATVDNRYRDYWVPVVSHILLALDSAVSGGNSRLIVIGATNFPDRLDEALVRPGRLDKAVHIPRPDISAIAGILRQHLREALPAEDLLPLAAIGQGATGAEVAGWARGARMLAREAGREMVLGDLLGQIAPPETRSPAQLLAVARHEAAHATATELLQVGTVTNLSLVSRGAFAGRTSARLRETLSMSAAELDALIVSTLAGRAADEHWGRVTSGSAGRAGSDLAVATSLVVGKHGTWGLGGSLLYRGDQAAATNLLKDPAFRKTCEADLDRLYGRARDFLNRHAGLVDRLAHRLVERRVMGGDEVRSLIGAQASGAGDEGAVVAVGGVHAGRELAAAFEGGSRHG
ncbi:AAA family ATPase [Methylorubrum podarium]|uniref:AAA family ATPase n=1 Tax=Methylorubrum podarium TaxID=200476 RepID=A0ABV1QQ29_9HYPH